MASDNNKLLSVFLAFLKLGITSFGGPVAHLGYFRQEFVVRRQWFTETDYAQLVAIGQFLPGPASSQVGFAIGLLRAGWFGALTAFFAFTMPSILIMVGVAVALPNLQNDFAIMLIDALKLLACIIVADAVIGMFRQFCLSLTKAAIAIAAFVILTALSINTMMLIVLFAAAILGTVLFQEQVNEEITTQVSPFSVKTAYLLLILFLLLFVTSIWLFTDPGSPTGIFGHFYQTGSLVFGGGHVVLPLLENQWVGTELLTESQFLSGYGAAQMLPGPLFSFAAYIGALIPASNQFVAVLLALLGIFLPGFLLMAAALPIWFKISHIQVLRGAVTALNAAVVGVLASVLVDPVITSGITDTVDIVIAILALVLLQTKKLPMVWIIFLSLTLRLIISLLPL